MKTFGAIIGGIIVLAILFVVGGSFYTVDQGAEAVILRNGAIAGTEGPGFHTKTPFIDAVVYQSLRADTVQVDKMQAYSNDQQPANIRISVTYQPLSNSGQKLYSLYGGTQGFLDKILTPRIYSEFKNVFGQYTAEQAIKQREKLNLDVLEKLRNNLDEATGLIGLVSVQVEDISFSDAYVASIEQKQLATVEVQKRQQELAQKKIEAEITVVNAQAQADSNLAVATAAAQATKLTGEADAYAIKVKSDALSANPNLIALTTAERWNGILPTTIPPNGTVPFLNINPTTNN